jgi:hypothetical protein
MDTALATIVSSRNEETSRAVAAFLSRYGAVTRASYASDLRA